MFWFLAGPVSWASTWCARDFLGLDVTLCNRGVTNPGLFEDLPRLIVDRVGDMSCLAGTWSEDSPVFDVAEGDVDLNSMDAYGQFKALAESEARRRFARHHIVRPGVIVGSGDPSDRLTYWVTRFADSGRQIVPEAIDASLQFIDVRDLADWLVHLGVAAESGTFNAVAPSTTLSSFLDDVERVSGSSVERITVTEDFMEENQIRPWLDIPMWLPPSDTYRWTFPSWIKSATVCDVIQECRGIGRPTCKESRLAVSTPAFAPQSPGPGNGVRRRHQTHGARGLHPPGSPNQRRRSTEQCPPASHNRQDRIRGGRRP